MMPTSMARSAFYDEPVVLGLGDLFDKHVPARAAPRSSGAMNLMTSSMVQSSQYGIEVQSGHHMAMLRGPVSSLTFPSRPP